MLELIMLTDVYKTVDKDTQILLKRNVRTKLWVYPTNIRSVCEVVRDKNRIYKNRCEIYVENIGSVMVAEQPSVLLSKLNNSKVKGYV